METIMVSLYMEYDTLVICVTEPQTAKYLNWVCQRLKSIVDVYTHLPFPKQTSKLKYW